MDKSKNKVILVDNCYLLINESKFNFSGRNKHIKLYVNRQKINDTGYNRNYDKCSNIESIEASELFRQDISDYSTYATFFIPNV